ncbi:hypothetical protein RND81_09G070000 [Saponaria officinalis]|uniref:Replication protein A 70 kDa DNA-binding subunit B/D first OB fold domain-containing protein n=1 Tax=Saponaria officinalis TaxID=3572 RepID=A0AAW1IIY2_SAPOF
MAPQLASIAKLTTSKARYQIIARATRIWEVPAKDEEKPYSLDMVLLDQEGSHIQATIPRRLINTFVETLKEGVIYKIQHFEVVAATRSYRPVTSTNNIIKWTSFTSIVEDDQHMPIPKHKFEFHPIQNLALRTNKLDYLIGKSYLTVIERKKKATTSKGETQLRYIYIEYERETQLQSTYATNININFDIPEARILKQMYLLCPTCKTGFDGKGKYRQCNKTTDNPIQR